MWLVSVPQRQLESIGYEIQAGPNSWWFSRERWGQGSLDFKCEGKPLGRLKLWRPVLRPLKDVCGRDHGGLHLDVVRKDTLRLFWKSTKWDSLIDLLLAGRQGGGRGQGKRFQKWHVGFVPGITTLVDGPHTGNTGEKTGISSLREGGAFSE